MITVRGHVGHRILRVAHSFLNCAVDFVYPPICLLCNSKLDASEKVVCESCWSFDQLAEPCLPIHQLDVLHHKTAYFERAIAIYEFSETIQDLIHVMKYKSRPEICARFGRDLGRLIKQLELLAGIDSIAPVPLHSLRYRERGFNQAGLIAREIGALNHIDVNEKLLRRTRYTHQQAKFNKDERADNVRNAFALQRGATVEKKRIAIVDDVLTTGSTMNECAQVLKKNGAREVVPITIVRI